MSRRVPDDLSGSFGGLMDGVCSCVVFDPLDGSSNIDAGVNVGTIFGVYKIVSGPTGGEGEMLMRCGEIEGRIDGLGG